MGDPVWAEGCERYGLVGNPVAHSRSPQIHRWFAERTGQKLDYLAIQLQPEDFPSRLIRLRALGVRGLNVTVPFKQQAYRYADECSGRASAAGAVNTLCFGVGAGVYGDNTDGIGLVRDLVVNHRIAVRDRDVLLLGAGGAARGALLPLLAERPRRLAIANRSADKVPALLRLAAADVPGTAPVTGGGLEDIDGPFELIINATSAGLDGEIPALADGLIAAGGCAYDMLYGSEPTGFMRWASGQGAAAVVDGLGMLVEQAAESFRLWRGVRPPTAELIERLRNS